MHEQEVRCVAVYLKVELLVEFNAVYLRSSLTFVSILSKYKINQW